MNLLLISRCPPYPLHLGDRLIPYHLAQQLSTRGYQIDLLAFYDQDDDLAQVDHYRPYFRDIKLIREPQRTQISYASRLLIPGRFYPHRAEQSWAPEMWQTIEAQIANLSYDVIQVFGGIQVYEYRDLVRKKPALIVPYESYSLFLQRALARQKTSARFMAGLQYQIARRYETHMFEGYRRVVVLADADAEMLRSLNPRLPLEVIPNGINLDYFIPQISQPESGTPVLLFLGNLEYAPNADAALFLATEILPLVQDKVPAVRLMLVGNNPPPEIQALRSDWITVTGRVPDVRPYYYQAHIFVSPLRFGAGIKNKVLEAMAMGKSLVATPLSGDGIGLIPETNVLYGESASALAAGILRLLNDHGLRQKMGQANRKLIVERFTWASVADHYEALYQEITAPTQS